MFLNEYSRDGRGQPTKNNPQFDAAGQIYFKYIGYRVYVQNAIFVRLPEEKKEIVMRLKKKDILIILGSLILLSICGIGSWLWLGQSGLMLEVILSSVLILTAIFETYRRLGIEANRIKETFSQRADLLETYIQRTEPLLSLFFTIKPQLPLPDPAGYAAAPDLLKKLMEIVIRERPALIVETGSGVSTVILAYCLRQIGSGKVISLEHDAKYAVKSQELIKFHSLEDIATVIHAPLVDYDINGKKWLWYDTSQLKIEKPIDLLVVDGPPRRTQNLARYPALPILYKHFGDKVIIIGDDGNRIDEKRMVEIWRNEFQEFSYEFLKLEKGAFLLYKEKK